MTQEEKNLICLYYRRMGFEVFNAWEVEKRNEYGVVTGSWK